MLLRYLYTHELPAAEDGGEGLVAGEMAKAADYFQAGELFEHCVEQFKGGLRVGNVVERLLCVHELEMPVLEEAAMAFIQENALLFQVRPCFSFCFSPRVCAAFQVRRFRIFTSQISFAVLSDALAMIRRRRCRPWPCLRSVRTRRRTWCTWL